MRTTPKIVVAGLASCVLIAFAAVAHAAVTGTPSGDTTVHALGTMRVAPGAVVLCLLGVAMLCLPRAKA